MVSHGPAVMMSIVQLGNCYKKIIKELIVFHICKNKKNSVFHEYILILGSIEGLPEEVTFMLRPKS